MRYSTKPFPPYSFLPGVNPHPSESPQGHSYRKSEPLIVPLTVKNWPHNENYLYGIDLYNHQYWWESHEAWEGLWKASSDDLTREFLQGLIKVSAAFIKWELKTPRGLKIHYQSALQHLMTVAEKYSVYMGIDLLSYIGQLEQCVNILSNTPVEKWPALPRIIPSFGCEWVHYPIVVWSGPVRLDSYKVTS